MATASNITFHIRGEAACLTCYMYGITGCDEHRPQWYRWATADTIQTIADFETVTVNGREVINVASHKKQFPAATALQSLIDRLRREGWTASGRRLDDRTPNFQFDLPPTVQPPKHNLKPLAAEHLKRHPYMVGIDPGMPESGFVVYNTAFDRAQVYNPQWESTPGQPAVDHNHWAAWREVGDDEHRFHDTSHWPQRPQAIDVSMEMYPHMQELFKDMVGRNPITKEQLYGNIDQLLGTDIHVVAEEEKPKMNRLEVIEREMKRLQREAAILSRFPKDDFAEGTVIKFEKVFGSWDDLKDNDTITKYSYVGVKVNGCWYCSGSMGHTSPQAYKWADLTEWMGDGVDKVYVLKEDKLIVGEEAAEEVTQPTPDEARKVLEDKLDSADPSGEFLDYAPRAIKDNPQA